jgi:DNA modification methylase
MITTNFRELAPDPSYSFTEYVPKERTYISHGYFTYPAKYIPQLANKLIETYSNVGDTVLDPFCGSGTSLIESMVLKRKGLAFDINEFAVFLTKVKSTFISNAAELDSDLGDICGFYRANCDTEITFENERIDYWFSPNNKRKLFWLLEGINYVENKDNRNFFTICFCQILKSSSRQDDRTPKPCKDKNKVDKDPFSLFLKHYGKMLLGNAGLGNYIKNTPEPIIDYADARNSTIGDETVDLIVTSPPYLTSYEYIDLFEWSLLWLGALNNKTLKELRQNFIGTSSKLSKTQDKEFDPEIVVMLSELPKQAKNKALRYYSDMNVSFVEMYRVLKKGGNACIVIGNTTKNGFYYKNAEIFQHQMEKIGFKTVEVICRELSSKLLPNVRDKKTGRFVKSGEASGLVAYPTEYILVMQK